MLKKSNINIAEQDQSIDVCPNLYALFLHIHVPTAIYIYIYVHLVFKHFISNFLPHLILFNIFNVWCSLQFTYQAFCTRKKVASHFLKSREPVGWPWCHLAASYRRPYCASVSSHSPVGLASRRWETVDWAGVLRDLRIQWPSEHISECASMRLPILQLSCSFFFFWGGGGGKSSHQPGLSAPL